MTDNRVALDHGRLSPAGPPQNPRRVEIFEGEKATDWLTNIRDPEYKATTERVYVIRVRGLRLELPATHRSRYTGEEIRQGVGALRKTDAGFAGRKQETTRAVGRSSK